MSLYAMPLVLLISGWAGSGKDAVAELLEDEMSFCRFAFADALKVDVSRATSLPLHYFHDRELKDTPIELLGVTPRQLLLAHAAATRISDPDIYSRSIAEAIVTAGHRIVISDWRYRQEYDYLRREHGTTMNVVRVRIERPGIIPSDDHTEHDLDDDPFDIVITNDGSISDLRDALKAAVRRML